MNPPLIARAPTLASNLVIRALTRGVMIAALAGIGVSTVVSTASAAQAGAAAGSAAGAPAPPPPANLRGDGSRMREMMRGRLQQRQMRGPQAEIDLKLTTDQLRDIVAGRLALSGNHNLKVGKVTAKEDGVAAVEIVTKTGALVDSLELSTKTGRPARIAASGGMGAGGMRPGAMGPGGAGSNPGRDLKLGVDQARKLAEAALIMRGNPRLKVGAVKEKDADTITVEIVAANNSLVAERETDRHSGRAKGARFNGGPANRRP